MPSVIKLSMELCKVNLEVFQVQGLPSLMWEVVPISSLRKLIHEPLKGLSSYIAVKYLDNILRKPL